MKFQEQLERTLFPYWKQYYLDYAGLKNFLKSLPVKAVKERVQQAATDLGCLPQDVVVPVSENLLPVRVEVGTRKWDIQCNPESQLVEIIGADCPTSLQQYVSAVAEANAVFRGLLDNELAKMELFFLQQLLTECIVLGDLLSGLLQQAQAQRPDSVQSILNAAAKVRGLLSRVISRSLWITASPRSCLLCHAEFDDQELTTEHLLDYHLSKRVDEFNDKEAAFCAVSRAKPKSAGFRRTISGEQPTTSVKGLAKDFSKAIHKIENWGHYRVKKQRDPQKQRAVFRDHTQTLENLLNFSILNHTGVRKIVKKYDKATRQSGQSSFAEFWMQQMVFANCTDDLRELMDTVERTYAAAVVPQKGTKKALDDLRTSDSDARTAHILHVSSFLGLHAGAILALAVLLGFEYTENFPGGPAHTTVLDVTLWTVFHWCGLPLMLVLGFAVNCVVWSHYRVNYVYICGFDPRRHITPRSFLAASLFLNLIWLFFVYCYVRGKAILYSDAPYRQSVGAFLTALPYISSVSLASAVLIASLKPGSSGRWLWVTILRMFPPRFPVRFADFFIADQLTSIGPMMSDTRYILCIWYSRRLDGYCSQIQAVFLPLLSNVPNYIRTLQCLRRFHGIYSQTRVKDYDHLWNAGKYTSAIIASACEFLSARAKSQGWPSAPRLMVVWLVVQVISTLYRLYWDLVMDWGLLRRNSPRLLLRKGLVYPVASYYVAMVVNIFLRFSWVVIMLIRMSRHDSYADEWFLYLWPVLEVFRRCLWNVFRMENEHLNNCGKFRPVKDVPIPALAMRLKNMQAEQQGAISPRTPLSPVSVEPEVQEMSPLQQGSGDTPLLPSLSAHLWANRSNTPNSKRSRESSEGDELARAWSGSISTLARTVHSGSVLNLVLLDNPAATQPVVS
eukprot:TRINITY_DN8118_c0_g1_i1.p1 TRINITY_DN8118_c0_g1~~TRINITY_DN8118_c0_g1_i1.p1  ORF type:complete len:901 (-),score=134.49 TRINITY_DN8118_c0_g1_i1:20-2722(-)